MVYNDGEHNNADSTSALSEKRVVSTRKGALDVSRRTLLKGTAAIGGALAAVGGLAVATQQSQAPVEAAQVQAAAGGRLREYWVQADSFYHNLVPTGFDGMMGMKFAANKSSYWAVGYRAYTPGWGAPLSSSNAIGANSGIPGPVLRGAVGDTIRVHFRNNDTHYKVPHSMHPHGVLYTPDNDGGWFYADPRPGTRIALGDNYTYEWVVRPNSVGTWVYHDHSVPSGPNMLMEFNTELGMFGFLSLTDNTTRPVNKEFFTFIHDLYQLDIPVLGQDFDCFNGHAYVGNTPTYNARVGDRVRWHIAALGKEFHVFHIHGHRWRTNGENGPFTDTHLLGPAMAASFEFVEDNPGKWLYHCHVTDHMMGGMTGLYVVE